MKSAEFHEKKTKEIEEEYITLTAIVDGSEMSKRVSKYDMTDVWTLELANMRNPAEINSDFYSTEAGWLLMIDSLMKKNNVETDKTVFEIREEQIKKCKFAIAYSAQELAKAEKK